MPAASGLLPLGLGGSVGRCGMEPRRQAGAPGKLLFMQLGPLPAGGGRKRGQLGFLGK